MEIVIISIAVGLWIADLIVSRAKKRLKATLQQARKDRQTVKEQEKLLFNRWNTVQNQVKTIMELLEKNRELRKQISEIKIGVN